MVAANNNVRVIDTSTATASIQTGPTALPRWTEQAQQDQDSARFVANPGCYPTGAIGLIRPLRAAGIIPADYPVTVNAVSGYTGGGKQLIAQMEDPAHPDAITAPHFLYGLPLTHKHVPEMTDARAARSRADLLALSRPLRAGHDRAGAAAILATWHEGATLESIHAALPPIMPARTS
jgi:N-acetyl-gamma-glutamyl-phosphate reductase